MTRTIIRFVGCTYRQSRDTEWKQWPRRRAPWRGGRGRGHRRADSTPARPTRTPASLKGAARQHPPTTQLSPHGLVPPAAAGPGPPGHRSPTRRPGVRVFRVSLLHQGRPLRGRLPAAWCARPSRAPRAPFGPRRRPTAGHERKAGGRNHGGAASQLRRYSVATPPRQLWLLGRAFNDKCGRFAGPLAMAPLVAPSERLDDEVIRRWSPHETGYSSPNLILPVRPAADQGFPPSPPVHPHNDDRSCQLSTC